MTISDVVLSHEASLAQFTFHTYVLIFAYLNGLQFTFWQADNAGDNFVGVNFGEGAVGNFKWCFVNSLQINLPAIFLSVIPVPIKVMGITTYFHVDFS